MQPIKLNTLVTLNQSEIYYSLFSVTDPNLFMRQEIQRQERLADKARQTSKNNTRGKMKWLKNL